MVPQKQLNYRMPFCLQIKRMEMEARSFSPERSKSLLVKVRDYKSDLAKLRETARAASQQVGAAMQSALAHCGDAEPLM